MCVSTTANESFRGERAGEPPSVLPMLDSTGVIRVWFLLVGKYGVMRVKTAPLFIRR
jgi:hypothetical protein